MSTIIDNNHFKVQLLGFKKAGNDYKLMPFKYGPKSVCVVTEEEAYFYPDYVKHTNFPPRPRCDFKSGTIYTIDNYVPNIKNLPPIFESGKNENSKKLC